MWVRGLVKPGLAYGRSHLLAVIVSFSFVPEQLPNVVTLSHSQTPSVKT